MLTHAGPVSYGAERPKCARRTRPPEQSCPVGTKSPLTHPGQPHVTCSSRRENTLVLREPNRNSRAAACACILQPGQPAQRYWAFNILPNTQHTVPSTARVPSNPPLYGFRARSAQRADVEGFVHQLFSLAIPQNHTAKGRQHNAALKPLGHPGRGSLPQGKASGNLRPHSFH